MVLARSGYDVIEASNGAEALELVADRAEPLAALVTDVVMPRMTGPQLVERLMDRTPGLPVVYVSRYTSEAVDEQGMLGPNAVFLGKPFSSESLHAKLAEAFRARRPAATGGGMNRED